MKQVYAKSGFTLIELLMVIGILAIITTLALSKFSSLRESSAQRLSLSNQSMIQGAVDTYLALNSAEGLNRLDALIDFGTVAGSGGTFNYTLNDTNAVGGIYRGPKPFDPVKNNSNKGMDSGLAKALCVYYLNSSEAAALKKLGLNYVLRSVVAAAAGYGGYGSGEDGSLILVQNELDPQLAPAVATTVASGLACAAIDPRYATGSLIYQACGQNLAVTNWVGQNVADVDVNATLKNVGGKLLAFGLNENASLIGKGNGGLMATPYSEVLPKEYYRQYILLIRLKTSGSGMVSTTSAEFAGVLDPQGNTIRSARHLF